MKKLVVLSLMFSIGVFTASFSQAGKETKAVLPTYKDICKNPNFIDGEELLYLLHYGFINGGYGSFTLKEQPLGGQNVYHAIAKGYTTGLADKLFKVVDVYESYFEKISNLPVLAVRNISENNYKYYDEVFYNHIENKIKSSKSGEHKIPERVLDMATTLYYVRRIDFSKFKGGEIVSVNTWFGDELFPFYIVFKGREKVKNPIGTFNCLKFVPIVEPGRIFKENDDMSIWLSDDENKIPVQIKFEMIVGSFKCDLVQYKNLKYDLKAKVK